MPEPATQPVHDDFRYAMAIAPDIIGELRAYTAGHRTGEQTRSAPGHKPTAPLNTRPVDDADAVYALIREHTHGLAAALGINPPRTLTWATPTGDDRGLPAGTPPEQAFAETKKLCTFLTHQLENLRDDDLATAIVDDLTGAVFRLDNRYPVDAPDVHVKARCGACETLAIYRRPPRSFGADETYMCTSCGKHHTETEITELMLARQKELKARGTR